MKIEVVTFEYKYCGECGNRECFLGGRSPKFRCRLTGDELFEIWEGIPSWCPLPDKKEENNV